MFFCAQAVPGQRADGAGARSGARRPGAWRDSRRSTTRPRSSAASIPCCWRRRASASWPPRKPGRRCRAATPASVKGVADQFQLVSDSLLKLHPPSAPLAQALNKRGRGRRCDRRARPAPNWRWKSPPPCCTWKRRSRIWIRHDAQLAARTARLAERLDTVRAGRPAGAARALDGGAVSPRQRPPDHGQRGRRIARHAGRAGKAAGPVLPQSRRTRRRCATRRATCRRCAACFRCWAWTRPRRPCCACARASRKSWSTEIDEERASAAGTFDKLGNNLGALGFLIDMLNYQPALAKKLFVYDDSTGELRPLMGRSGHAAKKRRRRQPASCRRKCRPWSAPWSRALAREPHGAARCHSGPCRAGRANRDRPFRTRSRRRRVGAGYGAAVAALSNLAAAVKPPAAIAPPAASEPDVEEDDLRDIFLEEAREVVQNGLTAIAALKANPGDISELTTLRRAFHTLKGSSRMVGLTEFGEAAWSLEQVLNTWLADQKPASEDLCTLSGDAMQAFGRWTEDIADQTDGAWKAVHVPRTGRCHAHRKPPGAPGRCRTAPPPAGSRLPSRSSDPTCIRTTSRPRPPSLDFLRRRRSQPASISTSPEPADFEFRVPRPSLARTPRRKPSSLPLEIEGIDFASLAAVSDLGRRQPAVQSGPDAAEPSATRRRADHRHVPISSCPSRAEEPRPCPSRSRWMTRVRPCRAEPEPAALSRDGARSRRGRRTRRTGQGHRAAAHRHPALQRLPQ